MVKVVKLDTPSIIGETLKSHIGNMFLLMKDMEKYAKEISPTDTGDYRSSFKVKIDIKDNSVVGELKNDSKHASGVETGFSTLPVHWHKGPPRNDGTIIYTGVGANVQQRTLKQFIKQIPKTLGFKSSK